LSGVHRLCTQRILYRLAPNTVIAIPPKPALHQTCPRAERRDGAGPALDPPEANTGGVFVAAGFSLRTDAEVTSASGGMGEGRASDYFKYTQAKACGYPLTTPEARD